MYNFNDLQLAQERYEEMVHNVELSASYNRDESGATPVRVDFWDKVALWKASLQRRLNPLTNRKRFVQRVH